MIRLNDLKIFVRTAALGSFSKAAREADLLPAQASAAVNRLEKELNVRLFARSTRSLRLTVEGGKFLPYAEETLNALQEGCEQINPQSETDLQGVLQVSAPSDLGRNVLIPWLSLFRQTHPQLSLRVQLSDQVSDVFSDPVDIALRYGAMEDASFIALPLASWNRAVLTASPEYLAQHPALKHPADLAHHNCLLYMIHGRLFDEWTFSRHDEQLKIQVDGALVCDDADIVHRWALAGEGIAYKSWLDVADDIAAGRLVELLPEWKGREVPLNLVCPHRKQFSPIVRLLYDFLKEKCLAAKVNFKD